MPVFDNLRFITGQLCAPGYTLPGWAQDRLHLRLWDRAAGPETPVFTIPLAGPGGSFHVAQIPEAATTPALGGPRSGPHAVASIGWGEGLNPALAHLLWPEDWASQETLSLGWDGVVTIIGYVEQLHLQDAGGLALAVLYVSGYAAPVTYRRLPPLPLDGDDPHGMHTDRRLDDAPEQGFYLLVDYDSPLAALAQDALVSTLRVVAVASLGAQDGGWHELVNLPLVLESLTLIGP